jgi:hypothetical protein
MTLTTDKFQGNESNLMIKIKMLKSCGANGEVLRKGEIKEVPESVAYSLIAYKNAELCSEKEKPKAKKKAAKKVAKAKPPVDAER